MSVWNYALKKKPPQAKGAGAPESFGDERPGMTE